MINHDYTYPTYAKILHLGMAGFGITAFLTGEFAENGLDSLGYLLHAYLGLSLATFVLLRGLRGLAGSGPLRFSGWSPFSRQQWLKARQDMGYLLRGKVPVRGMHEGLAGITQAFGIAIFAWMGVTGTGLFLLGGKPPEFLEAVHEVGEALIPLYLTLHVGSVVLHSLAGNSIWERMWKFSRSGRLQQADHLT